MQSRRHRAGPSRRHARFSPDLIATVRDRVDIVDVVRRHVVLQRVGREWVGLCPFHREKTPSFSVNANKHVYLCRGCGAAGDVFEFLKHVEFRRFNDVVRDLAGDLPVTEATPIKPAPRTPIPHPEELQRPDARELHTMWSNAGLLSDDDEAAPYLRGRRVDPALVDTYARVLPRAGRSPRWAWGPDGSWATSGHRLLVPMYDAGGVMRSVRARRVRQPSDDNQRKSLTPAGCTSRGLVFACSLGRLMLSGEPLTDGSPSDTWVRRVGVVIAEGEIDFLSWASRFSDANEDAPVVIGVVAGSWTPEVAARVPDTKVAVRTHLDRAGDRYADEIIATLHPRCAVYRLAPGTEASHA